MMSFLTITELGKAADVPTSTIRYYEKRGLMKPMPRGRGDYRRYDRAALARLTFIRAAQDSGFTLKDIEGLLALLDESATERCSGVQSLLVDRLDEVRAKLDALRQVQGSLASALRECRRGVGKGTCAILDRVDRETS